MAGKVIHVSDEVHAKVKAFCGPRKLSPKIWVEAVVRRAIDAGISDPENIVLDQLAGIKAIPTDHQGTVKKLRAEIKSLRFKLEREKERHQPVLTPVENRQPVNLAKAIDDESVYNQEPFWKRRREADRRREEDSDDGNTGGEAGTPVRDAHDVPGHA